MSDVIAYAQDQYVKCQQQANDYKNVLQFLLKEKYVSSEVEILDRVTDRTRSNPTEEDWVTATVLGIQVRSPLSIVALCRINHSRPIQVRDIAKELREK